VASFDLSIVIREPRIVALFGGNGDWDELKSQNSSFEKNRENIVLLGYLSHS
jgi:hypothetical protein